MRLDICTQSRYNKGFINVDGKAGNNVDIVADIRKRLPFENDEAEEIFSCATLEHLILIQAFRLLKEFNRILKPNGKLTIAVPDLEKICQAHLNRTFDYKLINQYLYGQLSDNSFMDFDCHKSAYNFGTLKEMLEFAGFKDIKEVEYDLPMHLKSLMIKVICKK